MKRLKFILPLLLMVLTSLGMSAQRGDRAEWDREMREFTHDFMTKKLQLTDNQKTKFFALYDAMSNERRALYRDYHKAKKALEEKGAGATEADYAAVNQMKLDIDRKVNNINEKYYKQFKSVLTQKQISKLKDAEDELMRMISKVIHEKRKKK